MVSITTGRCNHVPAQVDDRSSSSLHDYPEHTGQYVENRGPRDYKLYSQISCPSDFLFKCNPVSVKYSVLNNILQIVSANWPSTTPYVKQICPKFAWIYDTVKDYNLPNFVGARVPISSGLNVPNWAELLSQYHDNELCHFLQFCWPVGYFSTTVPESVSDKKGRRIWPELIGSSVPILLMPPSLV